MKSSSEMTDFLEKHIRWNVFAKLKNVNSDKSQVMPKFLTHLQKCNQTSNPINAIFFKKLCDNCNDTVAKENDSQQCTKSSGSNLSSILKNYPEPFITLGVLSLFGNLIAFIYEIKTLM